MKANILLMVIVSLILFVACTQTPSGKASDALHIACLEKAVCGDGRCDVCESCETCYQDCCPNTCFDTDGGQNKIMKGEITGIYQGKEYSFVDYCQKDNSVIEFFCGGERFNVPSNIRLYCEDECNDGACI